jgi:D-glucuronyl C5-epimerase C-terminus
VLGVPMRRRAITVLLPGLLAAGLLLPAVAAARKDPVVATLKRLERRGGTIGADAQGWHDDYRRAKVAARRLRGTPQSTMRGVLANLGSLARRHMLGSRGYPAFLILERNLQWFYDDRRSAPAYGTRTTFSGSELIWQFYPGSGWQLQPLANFGRLNGLLKLRKPAAGRLEKFADDMLATGVKRRGSLAFEYYFPWSGGAPGWISGMATATGMQAFANLAKRDGDTRYTDAARSMLGVFKAPPPWGVEVQGAAGPSFLLYSQSPSVLVGNGIAQALIALDNYRATTGDADAAALVDAALAEARRLLPLYDTGAWSLYDRSPTAPGIESDLSYHQLFEGFLQKLCDKFADPFCAEAENFQRYETEPVAIGSIKGHIQRRRKRIIAGFVLSKRGSVRVTLERSSNGHAIRVFSGSLLRGRHTLTWRLPPPGSYDLVVHATSLNGIASERQNAVKIAHRKRSAA